MSRTSPSRRSATRVRRSRRHVKSMARIPRAREPASTGRHPSTASGQARWRTIVAAGQLQAPVAGQGEAARSVQEPPETRPQHEGGPERRQDRARTSDDPRAAEAAGGAPPPGPRTAAGRVRRASRAAQLGAGRVGHEHHAAPVHDAGDAPHWAALIAGRVPGRFSISATARSFSITPSRGPTGGHTSRGTRRDHRRATATMRGGRRRSSPPHPRASRPRRARRSSCDATNRRGRAVGSAPRSETQRPVFDA